MKTTYTRAGASNYTAEQLEAVLLPRAAEPLRFLQDAEFEPESAQYNAVAKASFAVRNIYHANIRRAPCNPQQPEVFFDACAQTQYDTYAVIQQTHADEKEASIAMAVIRRAGLCDSRIRPTYPDARDAIRAAALSAAANIKHLFAKQYTLAFA